MKIAARLTLLLFVVFLATPTVVSVIKKTSDTSCFFSMTEEEQSKEIKADFKHEEPFRIHAVPLAVSSPIISENLSHHDNVSAAVFLPPPEMA